MGQAKNRAAEIADLKAQSDKVAHAIVTEAMRTMFTVGAVFEENPQQITQEQRAACDEAHAALLQLVRKDASTLGLIIRVGGELAHDPSLALALTIQLTQACGIPLERLRAMVVAEAAANPAIEKMLQTVAADMLAQMPYQRTNKNVLH